MLMQAQEGGTDETQTEANRLADEVNYEQDEAQGNRACTNKRQSCGLD